MTGWFPAVVRFLSKQSDARWTTPTPNPLRQHLLTSAEVSYKRISAAGMRAALRRERNSHNGRTARYR
jgi:hypothetical protein